MSNTPPDALYSIKTVSRLTGVNSATIRSWERRYGLMEPARAPNGRRAYSEADIRKLRQISDLVRSGHPIGEIAGLATELLQELQENSSPRPHSAARNPAYDKLMMAVSAGDTSRFRSVLGQTLNNLDPLEAVQDVIAPALREIGERWARGDVGIGLEHALSAITKQLLMSSINSMRWATGGPRIAIATPPNEQHELGALLAYYLASTFGAECTYMGPNMPVAALADAIASLNSQALVLSLIRERDDTDAIALLREISEQVPASTQIWLGAGRHASLRTELLPERITLFDSFEPFLVRLTALTK